MTRRQFLMKVRQLNRQNSRAILDRAEKVLRSGCLDLETAEDNYLLPKAFMTAACREMAYQYGNRSTRKPKNKPRI